MKKAFTLIELLVVVLIIAILAAIALPQYQKAVLKSRFSSIVPLAKALRDGNEAYYLTNGTYANDVKKLDVTTDDTTAQVTLGNELQHQYVRVTRPDMKNRITLYQKHSPNFPGETHCEALIDDAQANWLCKDSLQGTLVGNKYGYAVYSLEGTWNGNLDRIYSNLVKADGVLSIGDGDVCIATQAYSCYAGTPKITFENNAKCVANSPYQPDWYGCHNGVFKNDSVCISISQANRACDSGTYDHSSCVGNSTFGSCKNSKLENYSICYANVAGACAGSEYLDDTSCCYGAGCVDHKCEDNTYWGKRIQDGTFPAAPTYP